MQRAHSNTIDAVFSTYLEQTILPYALGEPLDAARAALVAKPWAAGVREWFDAAHWGKVFGLGEHFKAPAEAALSVLKAVGRPSPELDAAVGKKYAANTGLMRERFTLHVGKLAGLPPPPKQCRTAGVVPCPVQ
jgi:hypothetical protein